MTEEKYYQITVNKFIFKVRKGYYYSKDDSWVKVQNNTAKIGVSDFLQRTGGDVAFIESFKVGTNVRQFDEVGHLETIKAVIPVVSPVSGQIIQVNEQLDERPEIVNEDPYGSGWIVVVKLERIQDDLKLLLSAEQYFELMKEKIEVKQRAFGE